MNEMQIWREKYRHRLRGCKGVFSLKHDRRVLVLRDRYRKIIKAVNVP